MCHNVGVDLASLWKLTAALFKGIRNHECAIEKVSQNRNYHLWKAQSCTTQISLEERTCSPVVRTTFSGHFL